MKNYDEITYDLLNRRDRYVTEQKKKRKRMMGGAAAALGCFCLVALLGFGMWRGEVFGTALPDQTADDALYPGIKDNFDESKGESPDNPAANNKIVIHPIDKISSDRMNICLLRDDFVEMTRDEMKEYYGVDYVPDVPDDLQPWKNELSGIYRRDGGTGEVYWDGDILNYSNEDFTRSVHLTVAKGKIPWVCWQNFSPDDEKSVINNIELMIGKTESGCYHAEFMYENVGFILYAEGVTQDEFIAIISSILE